MKRTGADAVTVAVTGGLGNQMFQYAAGRALSHRLGVPLKLDLAFYRKGRHRTFELDRMSIVATLDGAPSKAGLLSRLFGRADALYREHQFHYDPAFASLSAPVRLEGYFQSLCYFEAIAPAIRAELTPPRPRDDESQEIAAMMAGGNVTSLHIRRGDYVTNSKAQALYASCSLEYYRQAVAAVAGSGPVVVFSDDIAWARENLSADRPLVFAGEKGPRNGLADLWLMTRATHHVIANSTFSWWGAWLAGETGGVTIAPDPWFNDPKLVDRDLLPSHWQRLPASAMRKA